MGQTMNFLSIITALLVFSFMIFIHEYGHYIAARRFGVTIEEFSIGMGPRLFSHCSKKTGIAYSLRALPIGGFVSMPGENGGSDDPNALCNKPVWKRMIVVFAGAFMNFVLGIVIMIYIVVSSPALGSTTIVGFADGSMSEACGLMIGDRIVEVDGSPVHVANELVYEVMRVGINPIDIKVVRGGEEITVPDVRFPTATQSGVLFASTDFYVAREEKTFATVVKHSFFRSVSTVKMIYESFVDLIGGRYGLDAVSGPIGVTEAIGTTVKTGGFTNLLNLVVMITMNLGVFNLLPLPALDGGRLVFMIVELVRRRPVDPELEAKIHAVGIIALLLLMAAVTYKDITKIFIG